jgi:flagellar motor switch protein FliN
MENVTSETNNSNNHEGEPSVVVSTRLASTMPIPEVDKSGNISMLMGVSLQLTVELGRTTLTVSEVLELQKGSVIELDRIAGEAVDIYVNNSLVARGDVVVVDDKFGVRITELVSPEKRF